MGLHKIKRMALALTFFRATPQRWQQFSQSHCTSESDETWVSLCFNVNVETNEQPKQWIHTDSPHKLKKFKQMSACI
jgi:hypothetical protein